VDETLKYLIKTLQVTQLKIRDRGSALTPYFNVYTDGKSTSNEELWVNFYTFLANCKYSLPLQGKGTIIKAPFNCGACHGIDHPHGLCLFPEVKG